MTEQSGYFLMWRGWSDHPVLQADRAPANRREAWAWLIEHAAWQPRSVFVGPNRFDLRRGQLAYSLRYLAKAWKWEEPKVRRFLSALRDASMIDAVPDAHGTLITICNYDKYQAQSSTTDAPDDALATRRRRTRDAKPNEGKERKEGNLYPDSSSPVSDAPSPPRDLFGGAAVVKLPPDITEQAATLWNAMAAGAGLSQVRTLTQQRRASLRVRLKECGGLDGWRQALEQVAASAFLRGENDRGWKADFDFVLQAKSFAKLREGVYANRGQRAPGGKLSWLAEELSSAAQGEAVDERDSPSGLYPWPGSHLGARAPG